MIQRLALLGVLTLTIFLLFLELGDFGLTDPHEGRHAATAREMAAHGDWLTPTFNGALRLDHPMAAHWATTISFRWLGLTEFAARLPSALCALLLILLQYAFLTLLRNRLAALFGTLMLLLNPMFLAMGKLALAETLLMGWMTLALYGFWLGVHSRGRTRHCIWLFYVGLGMAVLTQGIVGALIPLGIVVVYLTLTRQWPALWRHGRPVSGVMASLLLAVPWYLAMHRIHGVSYAELLSADEVVATMRAGPGLGATVLLGTAVFTVGLFPWNGFLPVAAYEALRRRPSVLDVTTPSAWTDQLEFFAALWVIVVAIVTILIGLPFHLITAFPAATLLTATYWHRALGAPTEKGLKVAIALLAVTGYVGGFTLLSARSLYSTFLDRITAHMPVAAQVNPGMGPMLAGFIIVIGVGLIAYFALSPERRAGMFWSASALMVMLAVIIIEGPLRQLAPYFIAPPHQLAYIARLNLAEDDRFLLYGVAQPSILFYAQRQATIVHPGDEADLARHLHSGERVIILLPSRLKPRLSREAGPVVPLIDRYGYSLVSNRAVVNVPAPSSPIPPNPHGF